jgi:hypothetical protein
MDDWWWTRTYEDTEEAEAQAQTRYENDADAHRKGE